MSALLFYILVPIISALLIGIFCLLKFWKFKGSEKLHNVTTKILKVLVVSIVRLCFLAFFFQIHLIFVFQKKNLEEE